MKTSPFHVIQPFHFLKRGTPVGFQIEVSNPESVQKIFFHKPHFERHRITSVRAKTIVQGSDVPVQRGVGVSVSRGVWLKGKPVNVTNDPSNGSYLLVLQIAIAKGKVEMLDAGLLTRPIVIPHFAAHESSPEVKPFQVDSKTHLLHDIIFFLHGRVGRKGLL